MPEDAAILLDAGNLSGFIGLFPFSEQRIVSFLYSPIYLLYLIMVRVIEVKV